MSRYVPLRTPLFFLVSLTLSLPLPRPEARPTLSNDLCCSTGGDHMITLRLAHEGQVGVMLEGEGGIWAFLDCWREGWGQRERSDGKIDTNVELFGRRSESETDGLDGLQLQSDITTWIPGRYAAQRQRLHIDVREEGRIEGKETGLGNGTHVRQTEEERRGGEGRGEEERRGKRRGDRALLLSLVISTRQRIFKTSFTVYKKKLKNEMAVIIFAHGNALVSDGGPTLFPWVWTTNNALCLWNYSKSLKVCLYISQTKSGQSCFFYQHTNTQHPPTHQSQTQTQPKNTNTFNALIH